VRDSSSDIFLWPPLLPEDFPRFGTVLIGKLFIIEIMNKADDSPLLLVLAALPCDITHYPFDGIGMLAQAIAFVILKQKF
jgi:hypothetical protein